MPLRNEEYSGIYDADDLALVQQAYQRCCEILDHDPVAHVDPNHLARYVLRAFEDSERDPELTAQRAAEIARMLGDFQNGPSSQSVD